MIQNNLDTLKQIEVGLNFINSYVKNCNNLNKSKGTLEWVLSNNLSTVNFKSQLKREIQNAIKMDPELGLGFDPIFDAQDYPEDGFQFENFKDDPNYLILSGLQWSTYKLTMKVVKQNGRWLVDGCGIINIPIDQRIAK